MKKFLVAGLLAGLIVAACGGGGSSPIAPTTTSKAVAARGTVTGFGSVIVDGVHFDTSKADIRINGGGGHNQNDLSVGQRVTVKGRVDNNGNHSADVVDFEAELRGSVTAINTVANTFTALGQTVHVDQTTIYVGVANLAALAVGDFLEVSGNRNADNSLQATFVKKEAPESNVQLRGPIAALDTAAKRFNIGPQVVDYATATLQPSGFAPANGVFVEVEGNLAAGILVATKVKQENDLGDANNGDEAELEGLILDVAADRGSFHINASLVRVDGNTTYVGGTAATLAPGVKVEVEGAIAADGALQARKVKFSNGSEDGSGGGSGGVRGRIEAAITAIDSTAKTFTVLGVVVQVADATVFRDDRDDNRLFTFTGLVVGDFVEVGFTRTGTTITASKVERQQTGAADALQGAVDSFDATAKTLVIDGINVDAASATYSIDETSATAQQFFGGLAVGVIVKVKGSFASNLLTAQQAALEHDH